MYAQEVALSTEETNHLVRSYEETEGYLQALLTPKTHFILQRLSITSLLGLGRPLSPKPSLRR